MPTSTHTTTHTSTYTLSPADKALWLALFSAATVQSLWDAVGETGAGTRLDVASAANIATKAFGMARGLMTNPPSSLDSDALAILELVMTDDGGDLLTTEPYPTRLVRAREWAQISRVKAARHLGMTPEELEAAEEAGHSGLVRWTAARLEAAAVLYGVNSDWLTGHGAGSIEDARRKAAR